MSQILFLLSEESAHTKVVKRQQYATVLLKLIRCASDAIDALSAFNDLLHDNVPITGSNAMISFDAHVGDMGCHLRASMICDLFRHHRGLSVDGIRSPLWISTYTARLVQARECAISLCKEITVDCKCPTKVGLGAKRSSLRLILEVLGWLEPPLEHSLDGSYPPARVESMKNGESGNCHPGGCRDPSHDLFLFHNECSTSLETQWDVFNPKTMVRFLVFTFILSKYKRFCCNENGITARQRMDIASGYEQDLAGLYCNIENQNFNFTSHHGLREEFKRIAIWVSDLSCSWILYQSINCFPNSDLTRRVLKPWDKL